MQQLDDPSVNVAIGASYCPGDLRRVLRRRGQPSSSRLQRRQRERGPLAAGGDLDREPRRRWLKFPVLETRMFVQKVRRLRADLRLCLSRIADGAGPAAGMVLTQTRLQRFEPRVALNLPGPVPLGVY